MLTLACTEGISKDLVWNDIHTNKGLLERVQSTRLGFFSLHWNLFKNTHLISMIRISDSIIVKQSYLILKVIKKAKLYGRSIPHRSAWQDWDHEKIEVCNSSELSAQIKLKGISSSTKKMELRVLLSNVVNCSYFLPRKANEIFLSLYWLLKYCIKLLGVIIISKKFHKASRALLYEKEQFVNPIWSL